MFKLNIELVQGVISTRMTQFHVEIGSISYCKIHLYLAGMLQSEKPISYQLYSEKLIFCLCLALTLLSHYLPCLTFVFVFASLCLSFALHFLAFALHFPCLPFHSLPLHCLYVHCLTVASAFLPLPFHEHQNQVLTHPSLPRRTV